MIKYGLKLWSKNKQWFSSAIALFKSKQIDFIELYAVPSAAQEIPNTTDLEIFKSVPTSIHAPHCAHNFNIFDLNEPKIESFKRNVIKTADFLDSKHIIVHAGIGQDKSIFKSNLAKIDDSRILIENMIKVSPYAPDKVLFGHNLEELNFIKQECSKEICFDFSHAALAAKSYGLDYKEYIGPLISGVKPFYFHLSGEALDKTEDTHLDIFDGDLDIKWIKSQLLEQAKNKDIYLVFEVPKKGNNLNNDIKNIDYFRNLN